MKVLALLIAYCEESRNDEAIKNARALSEEAIKQNIDKSKLFELWNKIQSQLPAVSSIVKIANGILKLITQSS